MKYSAVVLIALSVAGCGDKPSKKDLLMIEECNYFVNTTIEALKNTEDAILRGEIKLANLKQKTYVREEGKKIPNYEDYKYRKMLTKSRRISAEAIADAKKVRQDKFEEYEKLAVESYESCIAKLQSQK